MSKLNIFRAESLKEIYLFIFLLLISLITAYSTVVYGIKAGSAVFALIISMYILACIFYRYTFGFYTLLFYTHFMFLIGAFVTLPVPMGTLVDAILFLTLFALLIQQHFQHTSSLTKEYPYRNAIGIFIIISVLFDVVQVLNPLSPLSMSITVLQLRESSYLFFIYLISYKIFKTRRAIIQYTIIWVMLSFLVAAYGLVQEFVGLRDFEREFLTSDPRRLELYFIWGRIRKWSFLSDPSVFGMQVAFCGIFCFVIALGKFAAKIRISAVVISALSLLSMSYSGTRTAVGMVPLGVALYFFMTLNNPKTLVASILTGLIFLAIIFGPFYGSTAIRIRSTFNKEDASMSFRDGKRHILQKHIFQYPLGSGLGSANGISERLTITPDTDSGYVRTAVDKGILGLLIQLGLYCSVMIMGIRSYYRCRDGNIKSLYAAYLAGFFALTFANFYQDVPDQKPLSVLIITILAIIPRLEKAEES